MRKLLVILLLLLPVHGAWANESWTQEDWDEFYSKHKKPNKYEKYANPPPEPEEKTWLEKQKDKRKKKADAKYFCAIKSGKAKNSRATERIYQACMEREGY